MTMKPVLLKSMKNKYENKNNKFVLNTEIFQKKKTKEEEEERKKLNRKANRF